MSEYTLEIKQIVDYPRCRIYRQFVQALIADRSIRVSGGSGLFYFVVLCAYANFRTSYKRIDGISYTIYPGEWIMSVEELSRYFRTRFRRQTLTALEGLQKKGLISFLVLGHGKLVNFKIRGWRRHNTILDYNAPCQKDTGFFFFPVSTATELVSASHCSEMDAVLDLWLNTVYNDPQVLGSDVGPVVYLRNGTGCPLVSYPGRTARIMRSGDTIYIYSADLNALLATHDVTWSRRDSFCEGQYEAQPEELPTVPVKTQIRQLPKPAANLSFAKFDFDDGEGLL